MEELEVLVRWMDGDLAEWRRARIEETPTYLKVIDIEESNEETRIPWVNIRTARFRKSRWTP